MVINSYRLGVYIYLGFLCSYDGKGDAQCVSTSIEVIVCYRETWSGSQIFCAPSLGWVGPSVVNNPILSFLLSMLMWETMSGYLAN